MTKYVVGDVYFTDGNIPDDCIFTATGPDGHPAMGLPNFSLKHTACFLNGLPDETQTNTSSKTWTPSVRFWVSSRSPLIPEGYTDSARPHSLIFMSLDKMDGAVLSGVTSNQYLMQEDDFDGALKVTTIPGFPYHLSRFYRDAVGEPWTVYRHRYNGIGSPVLML